MTKQQEMKQLQLRQADKNAATKVLLALQARIAIKNSGSKLQTTPQIKTQLAREVSIG